MEVVTTTGKEVHTLAGDTGNVDAMYTGEVHLAQGLTVHRGIGNYNTLRHQRLLLIILRERIVDSRADKRADSFSVVLGTHDIHLIIQIENSILVRNHDLAIVKQTRAHDITIEELGNLLQCLASKIRVAHLQVHRERLLVRILIFQRLQLLILILQTYLADVANGNGSTDNAKYTQGVSTGISRSDGRHLVCREDRSKGLIGCTQTRCVGYRAIQRSDHHRQIVDIRSIEKEIIAGKHHANIKQDSCRGQEVESNAALLETLKKARANLQTNHKHKEDETEVLNKRQDIDGSRKADMSRNDTCEQNKGYTQRNAANLDFTQQHAYCNHYRKQKDYVGNRILLCKKVNEPIHKLYHLLFSYKVTAFFSFSLYHNCFFLTFTAPQPHSRLLFPAFIFPFIKYIPKAKRELIKSWFEIINSCFE